MVYSNRSKKQAARTLPKFAFYKALMGEAYIRTKYLCLYAHALTEHFMWNFRHFQILDQYSTLSRRSPTNTSKRPLHVPFQTVTNSSNRILVGLYSKLNGDMQILPNFKVERSKLSDSHIQKPFRSRSQNTKHFFLFCVENCPRFGHLKFPDLRTLTSFSWSKSRTPFGHFCTSPIVDDLHTKNPLASTLNSFRYTHTPMHTHVHLPITARAIYRSRCENSKRQTIFVVYGS